MSLKYVTRKLKSQTLTEEEDEAAKKYLAPTQPTKEKEASGSESDDEEFGENAGNNNEDESTAMRRYERETHASSSTFSSIDFVCDDNYSSEEELKEIIYCERQRKKSGASLSGTLTNGANVATPSDEEKRRGTPNAPSSLSRSSTRSSSGEKVLSGFQPAPAEKRKWSEMSGGCDLCGGDGDRGSSSGSCSCDEEEVFGCVSGAEGPSGSSDRRLDAPATPVQFCTSPPIDVHKPRQHSASPPAKLFHLAHSDSDEIRHNDLLMTKHSQICGATTVIQDDTGSTDDALEDCGSRGKMLRSHHHRNPSSPNKRHRLTPRPHHIQRPCLDFEKMQQIKKRVVTSWRPQGTELSLFCW